MNINTWNKESYKEFINYLYTKQDLKYKEFHKGLVLNSKYEIIGIRLPIMREIAKNISKTNIEEFLKVSKDNLYEEVMIQGLVISYIKDEVVFNKYFNKYINKIDNWALCDTFCTSIKKIIKKNKDKYFDIAINLSLKEEEFLSRVGYVILMDCFIEDKYLNDIYNSLDNNISDKYYINMAKAWLLAELYIKEKDKTLPYIKNNKLDKFTQNKAISKINDSLRITKEEKEYLKQFRK